MGEAQDSQQAVDPQMEIALLYSRLDSEVQVLTGQNAALKGHLESALCNVDQVQEERRQQTELNEQLRKESDQLHERVGALEADNAHTAQLREVNRRLEADSAQLRGVNQKLEADRARAEQKVVELEKKLAGVNDALAKQRNDAARDVSSLKTQQQRQAERHAAELEALRQTHAQQVAELQRKLVDANGTLVQQREDAGREISSLRTREQWLLQRHTTELETKCAEHAREISSVKAAQRVAEDARQNLADEQRAQQAALEEARRMDEEERRVPGAYQRFLQQSGDQQDAGAQEAALAKDFQALMHKTRVVADGAGRTLQRVQAVVSVADDADVPASLPTQEQVEELAGTAEALLDLRAALQPQQEEYAEDVEDVMAAALKQRRASQGRSREQVRDMMVRLRDHATRVDSLLQGAPELREQVAAVRQQLEEGLVGMKRMRPVDETQPAGRGWLQRMLGK